ncbi:MAG: response regulator transcription factor [Candidatus Limnocylindrales bacterium]
MFEPSESRPRILIVDGDRRVRRSLSGILEASDRVEVVGCVSTAVEALDLAIWHCPDALLIDLDRSDAAALLELIPAFRSSCDHAAIVVLSGTASLREIAFQAGADEFLNKYEAADELAEAVAAIAAGSAGWTDPASDVQTRRTQ